MDARSTDERAIEERPTGEEIAPRAESLSPESPPVEPADPRPWRRWLAGSPREVLARIVSGDPLGVRGAVAAALREQAVLLDADRAHLRALALVARAAPRYLGKPALATWLAQITRSAIDELLREDAECTRLDAGGAFAQLARPLGIDPESARRGCAAFNRLPRPERCAFFALVLEGRALDELARTEGESATSVARKARRALDVLLHASHPELPPRRAAIPGSGAGTGTATEAREEPAT